VMNPEIDANNFESFIFQYAAFYQTSGTIRSGTPIISKSLAGGGTGGRNPVVPNPAGGKVSQPWDNAQWGVPNVWIGKRPASGAATDPNFNGETNCWIQAVEPSEIDNPGRVYYYADSREYRPEPTPNTWPSGTINDGWLTGYGNKVFLGTRHGGFPNVGYMDGHANAENLMHLDRWNMTAGSGKNSDEWRCSTFTDNISIANIGTQHHIMPILNAVGWESFLSAKGQ